MQWIQGSDASVAKVSLDPSRRAGGGQQLQVHRGPLGQPREVDLKAAAAPTPRPRKSLSEHDASSAAAATVRFRFPSFSSLSERKSHSIHRFSSILNDYFCLILFFKIHYEVIHCYLSISCKGKG